MNKIYIAQQIQNDRVNVILAMLSTNFQSVINYQMYPAQSAITEKKQPQREQITGECYCGQVKFVIKTDPPPFKCLYCHCESCRRAHSAPLYQICYIPTECFDLFAGKQNITEYSRNKEGSPIRAFCKICGSRIYNKLPAQPELGIGFFPALLKQETQHNLPQILKPRVHYLSHQSILNLCNINDGLDRV